jgi:hypothetical protein
VVHYCTKCDILIDLVMFSKGPVRKILHPFIYFSVASSYLIMEVYIKWKTHLQNTDSLEGENSNLNKSGPVSLSITLSFVVHTLSDFTLPKLIKGHEYYPAKVLISNMVIISPTVYDVSKSFNVLLKKCFAFVKQIILYVLNNNW